MMKITEKQQVYRKIAVIISVIMLILAIPNIWPYAYFQILRWVITASAAYIAWLAYEINKTFWAWTMVIIAILFNPMVPFYLNRGAWILIDLIVIPIFLISLKLGKKN